MGAAHQQRVAASSTAEPAKPGNRPVLFLGNHSLPPMNYLKNGKPTGIVVDLAEALAQRMRYPVEIRLMDWAEAQQRVLNGQADALLQINENPERLKLYDFSQPLLPSEFTIFIAADRSGITSKLDLRGLRVGVERKGLPILLLQKDPQVLVEAIPDFVQGFRMLAAGDIDAVVADRWVGGYVLAENNIKHVKIVEEPISASYSAIAVKKGNASLLADINKALSDIRSDGAYDKIIEKWKGQEVIFKTREQLNKQKLLWLLATISLALLVSLVGIAAKAREIRRRKQAEHALQEYIGFLECLDRLDRVIRKAPDMERMMSDALDVVLDAMDADRAWLGYICDPGLEFWCAAMERSRPEWPGISVTGEKLPMSPDIQEVCSAILGSEHPIVFGPGGDRPIAPVLRDQFSVQTQICLVLHPLLDQPWMFGLHQCSRERAWTSRDKALFEALGGRIRDALNSLLFLRQMQESEERFRALVDQAQDAIFVHDLAGRFLLVNQRACKVLGYSREELLGMAVPDVDPDFQVRDDPTSIWNALPQTFESRHRKKDGSLLPVEIRLCKITYANQQVLLAAVRDIAERKLADRLRSALFDNSGVGVFLGSPERVILKANKRALEIFGYQAWEMEGQNFRLIHAGDDTFHESRTMYSPASGGPLASREYPYRRKDGSVIWCSVSGGPLDPDDIAKGFVWTFFEITERKRAEQALAASEEKFRTVADFTYDWEYWINPEGRLVWVSPSCELVTGYTAEEFMADPDLLPRIIHPDDRGTFGAHLRDVEQGSIESSDMDFRIVHSSGQTVWINHYCQDITRADGAPLGRRASNRDITDRKRAEDHLAWELAVNRAMSELSGALIATATTIQDIADLTLHYSKQLTSSEHGFVSVIDPKTRSMVGYTLTRMMDKECRVEPDQARIAFPCGRDGQYPKLWGHVLNNLQPFYTNDPAAHPAYSGTPAGHVPLRNFLAVPALIEGRLIGCIALANTTDAYTDQDLKVVQRLAGLFAVAMDREATMAALRTGEQQIRGLFNATTDSVMLLDASAHVLAINAEGAKRRGLDPLDLAGRDLEDILPAEAAARRREGMRECARTRRWLDINEEIENRLYHVRMFPILSESGEAVQFAIFSRDVTKSVMDEEALRSALARAEELADKAEAANKAKSEFLANMSHEIRTPLNGIMGMLQLLQTTPLHEEQGEYLDNAVRSSRRLTRLLGDILDISVIESGRLAIQAAAFGIQEICQSVGDLFAQEAAGKGLALRWAVDPSVPAELVGDEARLRQILFNLVGNAVKFTVQGGVEIGIDLVSPPGDHPCRVLFSVVDTGIGIPDNMLSGIFEPFTQVEGSFIRRYQGAGLGLAIVRRLTRLMGGELCIASELGAGTSAHAVFLFDAQMQPRAGQAGPCEAVSAPRGNLRILLVEDENTNLLFMKYLLEKNGHSVAAAGNGLEALECLRHAEFDLVVMDVQMPVMDGVEATRTIRNSPEFAAKSRIPIIAVTAYAMAGDRETFLAAGMDGYITKPVEMDALTEVVNHVMARGRQGGARP